MYGIKNRIKFIAAACLLLLAGFSGSALGQETIPKAGLTIDKSNIDTYKDLFPEEFLDAFTTGWEMIEPLSLTIKEPVANPYPKAFTEASEKNRGKYSTDAEGYITGGTTEEIVGLPFPEVSPEDENFPIKFMWNFDYRYQMDDGVAKFITYQKRRESAMTTAVVEQYQIYFQNRMFDDPKPLYKTKNGLRYVNFLKTVHPPVQKNFITFLIRYVDQKVPDTTYVYLPSMRRVLRGEAGQRSTPINSSTQAPDDFQVFMGRIPDFTYKLVGEQKMVVLGDARFGYSETKDKDFESIPMEQENWMVKDVYVFDIIPKDKKYPQGKKRIWVDKENYWAYYGAAYDRSGALWKVWQQGISLQPMTGGGTTPALKSMLGMDIQLGYTTQMIVDNKVNGNGLSEADATIAAIRKRAR